MSIFLSALSYITAVVALVLVCFWLLIMPCASLILAIWSADTLGIPPRDEFAHHVLILASMVVYVAVSAILVILTVSLLRLFLGVIG